MPQEYELVEASSLHLDPENPHESDVEAISGSIGETGFYGALLVQRSSRRVIAGHGRLQAAVGRGLGRVPVLWLDVPDETARKILLADNRLPELGGFDQQKLVSMLSAMPDLQGTGYLLTDLDALKLELEQMGGLAGRPIGTAREQPQREAIVAVLIAVSDVGTVEQALAETGELSRGAALLQLARSYLNGRA